MCNWLVLPHYVKESKGVTQHTHQEQRVFSQISSIQIVKINLLVVRIVRGILNAGPNIYPIKVGINIKAVPPPLFLYLKWDSYFAARDFLSLQWFLSQQWLSCSEVWKHFLFCYVFVFFCLDLCFHLFWEAKIRGTWISQVSVFTGFHHFFVEKI